MIPSARWHGTFEMHWPLLCLLLFTQPSPERLPEWCPVESITYLVILEREWGRAFSHQDTHPHTRTICQSSNKLVKMVHDIQESTGPMRPKGHLQQKDHSQRRSNSNVWKSIQHVKEFLNPNQGYPMLFTIGEVPIRLSRLVSIFRLIIRKLGHHL